MIVFRLSLDRLLAAAGRRRQERKLGIVCDLPHACLRLSDNVDYRLAAVRYKLDSIILPDRFRQNHIVKATR